MTDPGSRSRGADPNEATAPFVMQGGCVDLEGERILDGVDLTIHAGAYVVLLGENGSGKTTLLRALLGLTPLAAGTVVTYGTPLARFTQWHRLAYVPQRLLAASAVPVSVLEAVNAASIPPARRWTRSPKAERARSLGALDRLGLAHRAADRLDTLSGGQQRRVMVARALSTGADTILLDEPSAGVDANSELTLADTLADLHSAGTTVVLVTHDLGELTAPATQVVVLGGRGPRGVLYDGPPPPPAVLRDQHAHVWHRDDDFTPDPARPGLVTDL